MKIQCYKKTIYGITRIYIIDKEISDVIEILTGNKTLSRSQIEALKALGHVILISAKEEML